MNYVAFVTRIIFVLFDRDKVAASASLTSRAGVPPLLGYHQGLVPYEGTVIKSILFQFWPLAEGLMD